MNLESLLDEPSKAFMYSWSVLSILFLLRITIRAEKARKDPSFMEESIKIASMCKWYGARLAVEACDLAVDVLGGLGYFAEEDISRWYKFAKQLELVEGTKEVQKNAIARIMLGGEIAKHF